jgi:hypothetical protein
VSGQFPPPPDPRPFPGGEDSTAAALHERVAELERELLSEQDRNAALVREVGRLEAEIKRLCDPTFGREPADWPPAEYREGAG